MVFTFKRKYDYLFIFFIITFALAIGGTFFVYYNVKSGENIINPDYVAATYFIIWLNLFLLNLLYYNLSKRKYNLNKDRIHIRRAFIPDLVIKYDQVRKIVFNKDDSVFLIFGTLPSCTIYFNKKGGNKLKKTTLRADRTELLYKVIENEANINQVIIAND